MNSKMGWVSVVLLAFMLIWSGNVQADEEEVPVGTWVEEIIVTEEESASAALTQIEVGELDLYPYTISDPELYDQILETEELRYEQSFGSYNEITFNPAGPEFEGTGELNPFAVPAIREAINWLVDREYIVDEIFGGLAAERVLPLNTVFPDHARHIVKARELEAYYSYDPARAEEQITEEMEELGANMVDGTWHYNGDPVELIFIIRSEDERLEIGDYIATELEDIGFAVDRQYMTAAEASPIWMAGDPHAGEWHLYTGGWISTVVSRDQAGNFDFFFTPRGMAQPLYMAYDPVPEFDELSDRLARRDFSTMEEREEMMERALELALETSKRVMLVDESSVAPMAENINVAADIAGGVHGSYMWAYTLRDEVEKDASIDMAMPSIIPDPWNPTDGSNWIYDMMLIRGTSSRPTMFDPFTGLHWDQLIEKAEVTIKDGLPVERTLDWVELDFAEEIEVPEDAWIGWDPEEQVFSDVGTEHPDGLTANRKVTVYYPEGFQDEHVWHDGSTFDLADMILPLILAYDRAKEDSPVFDEAQVPGYETFIEHFRGVRIVSEDPIVFEYYSDTFYLDAEWNAYTAAWSLFPWYDQGIGAWHTLGLGLEVEAAEQAAHSASKADALGVEWLSMIGGPSLDYLEEHLEKALDDDFIPYEPTLGQFIDEEDAADRWGNLQEWYDDKEHFWVGNGPFYLRDVHPVEGVVEMARNEDFLDDADRWVHFEDPPIADISIDGPHLVEAGEEAVFDAHITFADEPYAVEEMDTVAILIFDADGELVESREVDAVEDGLWRAELPEEVTEELPTGGAQIEFVATPMLVAIPTIEDREFVIYR